MWARLLAKLTGSVTLVTVTAMSCSSSSEIACDCAGSAHLLGYRRRHEHGRIDVDAFVGRETGDDDVDLLHGFPVYVVNVLNVKSADTSTDLTFDENQRLCIWENASANTACMRALASSLACSGSRLRAMPSAIGMSDGVVILRFVSEPSTMATGSSGR